MARTGRQSLKLTIQTLPLFARLPLPTAKEFAEATNCLAAMTQEEGLKYLNDESERAEIKELKDLSPKFTDDYFYGFSLAIPRASAPPGDYNRMVVGQWKLARKHQLPSGSFPYDSPFIALRVTGGFFHIMLTVKAVPQDTAQFSPKDCRVFLAFSQDTPPHHTAPLDLRMPARCESRLNYDVNQGQPVPVNTLRVDRSEYLPNPWDADGNPVWVDLVFHIKGGDGGSVDVWSIQSGQKKLVAHASGWIGYEGIDQAIDIQYFKLGPYRDPAGYDATVYLDNVARGHSFEEVDPSKGP
jgi:hypothetical protein